MSFLTRRSRARAADGVASTVVDEQLAAADAAETSGDLVGAIDLLQAADGSQRDPVIEARLVRLRHAAFADLEHAEGRPSWPLELDDRFPEVADGPPEITPDELSSDVLGSALVNHGALLVRGLVPSGQVDSLIAGIDRAFAGRDAWEDDRTVDAAPWFLPFEAPDGSVLDRQFVREGGAVWVADSPRVLAELVDAYEGYGLGEVIGGYLGERPALSLRKFTLRRVPADLARADWHQDGAFLGDDVRSVNVWLSLTDCGTGFDAPGLEIVSGRVPRVLGTGSDGAFFNWSIGPELVDRMLSEGGPPLVRPSFRAGDALLFDDLLVHRTAIAPGLGHDRYAVESWFFAPSRYPSDQLPFVF